MLTVHNELWTDVLIYTAARNFDAIFAGGMTVDNGENAPPEMLFEPWMRTEIGCWGEVVDGVRVAYLRFRAGPEDEPFQELLVKIPEHEKVTFTHTGNTDEYRLCEMASNLIHLIAHQKASIAGRPGCCCPDQSDGGEHVHPEFIVMDVPSDIGRGLTDILPDYILEERYDKGVLSEVVPVAKVTPLRLVKNDAPRES